VGQRESQRLLQIPRPPLRAVGMTTFWVSGDERQLDISCDGLDWGRLFVFYKLRGKQSDME
jgi:hypothetical protein